MPVSRADFIRGRTIDSDEEKVTKFLTQHKGEAFTAEEIAKAIGHKSTAQVGGNTEFAETLRLSGLIFFDLFLQSLVIGDKIVLGGVQTARGFERYYAALP
ncbi:MAG: hypothetical protein L3K07_03825 [Thermoplasmata archaeon]|nr:hypothetical protein [Thermoplasmata archaeon]